MLSLAAIGLFLLLLVTGAPVAIALGLGSAAALWWFDMPLAVVAQRIVNALDSTTLLALALSVGASGVLMHAQAKPAQAQAPAAAQPPKPVDPQQAKTLNLSAYVNGVAQSDTGSVAAPMTNVSEILAMGAAAQSEATAVDYAAVSLGEVVIADVAANAGQIADLDAYLDSRMS